MDIYVNKDGLSDASFQSSLSSMENAVSQLKAASSVASGCYGYQGRLIFAGELSELQYCITEASELLDKLEKYAGYLASAPTALIEADAEFDKMLSNVWERFIYGSRNQKIIPGFSGLFSFLFRDGKTGAVTYLDPAEDTANREIIDKAVIVATFEKSNPEKAALMNKVLSDPDLTEQERLDIKYIAYNAPEPYQTIYFENLNKYQINVGKNNKTSEYREGENTVYLVDSDDTFLENPIGEYDTVFHECGHAIDDQEFQNGFLSNSFSYNGQSLHDMVVEDTRNYVNDAVFSQDPILSKLTEEQKKIVLYKLNLTDDAEFYDYFHAPERESEGVVEGIVNAFKDFSSPLSPWELDDPILEEARIRTRELMFVDLKENSDNAASDVFGGVTNNAITGKYCHSTRNYWYNKEGSTGKQERELWAEFFAAQMTHNEAVLESIQRHFPKAYEAMEAMAKNMASN